MPYVITAACVDTKDTACVEVCPVDCIHPTDGENEPMLYIDPDECIDCGACEPECPVEAIYAEDDLPEEGEVFIEVNVFILIFPFFSSLFSSPRNFLINTSGTW